MAAAVEGTRQSQSVEKRLSNEEGCVRRVTIEKKIADGEGEEEVRDEPAEKFVRPESDGDGAGAKGIGGGKIVKQAAKILADDAHLHVEHGRGVLLGELGEGGDARVQNIAAALERDTEGQDEVVADVGVERLPVLAAKGEERAAGHSQQAAVAFLLAEPVFVAPIEVFGFDDAGLTGIGKGGAVGGKADGRVGEVFDEEAEGV